MNLNETLTALLRDMGADLVRFGDVQALAPDGYRRCVVAAIALPLSVIEQIPEGPTEHYLQVYRAYNQRLDEMAEQAAAYLNAAGYRSIPVTGEHASWDRQNMATPFPYKTAATRSGLGWIGKSALLVTPEFGPAVRMTTVLTDAPLTPDESITESRCGSCTKCVEVCPGQAITGRNWYAGMPREELVDIPACDTAARDIAEEKLGLRATMCGRCFAICPYTQAYCKRAKKNLAAENGDAAQKSS